MPVVPAQFPASTEARSVIYAIETDSRTALYAAERDRAGALPGAPAAANNGDRLTVLLYAHALKELQIAPGVVQEAVPGQESRGLPPFFVAAYQSELENGSVAPFRPLTVLDAALLSVRLP